MNHSVITGNLTRDVEKKEGGAASFSVAVNRAWKDSEGVKHEDVDFVPVIVFGSQATNCLKYLHKGSKVGVEGRISVRQYEKEGQKRTYTSIVGKSVEFLSPPKGEGHTQDVAPAPGTTEEVPF